jgi:hypothetical protein
MKRAITPGQINIPRRPRSGGDVKYVVDGLVTAVQQLRDRPVYYDPHMMGLNPRPFAASSTGTSEIYIAPGFVTGLIPRAPVDGENPSGLPAVGNYWKFEGGAVDVTEDEGFIYLKIEMTGQNESAFGPIPEEDGDLIFSAIYRPSIAPTVYFSQDNPDNLIPSGEFSIHLPIAKVSLSSDGATIDFQILDHNPMIQYDENTVIWGSA